MSDSTNSDKTKAILNTIKTYVIVVIGFGISAVAIIAVIVPLFSNISTISQNIRTEEAEVEKVRIRAEYLQRLSGLEQELDANVETAEQSVPLGEDSIPYVLDQIVYMARQAGMEVESLALGQIANSADANKPNVVRIQLNATGQYANFLSLLESIEMSRRIINVSGVAVTIENPTEEDTELTSRYTVNLTLNTYFMPEIDTSALTPDLFEPAQQVDQVLEKLDGMDFYTEDQLLGVPDVEIIPLEDEEETGIVPLPQEQTTESVIETEENVGIQESPDTPQEEEQIIQ